jgi:hypothetical protein
MSDPTRSADKAYYASRVPLDLRGTREGRSNPPKAPSYQHKGFDSTASSDKYYASQPSKPAVPEVQAVRQRPRRSASTLKTELIITDTDNLLKQLGDILEGSDAEVVVKGESELIRRARMLLDLSVGRGEFTRQQADAVSFAAVQQEIVVPVLPVVEPEPVVEEVLEPEVEAQPKPSVSAEIEEIAEPVVSTAKKSKPKPVKKAKKPDTLNLTEEDIAAAFGLGDDSDD